VQSKVATPCAATRTTTPPILRRPGDGAAESVLAATRNTGTREHGKEELVRAVCVVVGLRWGFVSEGHLDYRSTVTNLQRLSKMPEASDCRGV